MLDEIFLALPLNMNEVDTFVLSDITYILSLESTRQFPSSSRQCFDVR